MNEPVDDSQKEFVPRDGGLPRPNSSSQQEWLIDEALKETLPASDPISPAVIVRVPKG